MMNAQKTTELMRQLKDLDGFIAAALVSLDSGMAVAKDGDTENFNVDVAAAVNSEVVRSKRKAIERLGLRDDIEDILITLGQQFHLIRPLKRRPNYFFYVALDRARANMALARMQLEDTERKLSDML